jgi:hypothetical protein
MKGPTLLYDHHNSACWQVRPWVQQNVLRVKTRKHEEEAAVIEERVG